MVLILESRSSHNCLSQGFSHIWCLISTYYFLFDGSLFLKFFQEYLLELFEVHPTICSTVDLTVQLSDHLFQLVILEGFHKELTPKKRNIYERNFKNFSEREFNDILKSTEWENIIMSDKSDPNLSMNNLHVFINFILDVLAPYKKLSKKELKLKSKPWINNKIQHLMKKRDQLPSKYSKLKQKDVQTAISLYNEYKLIRNKVTSTKHDNKLKYYKTFFEFNKNKMSSTWEGIRSIVNISNSSKKDIMIVNSEGKKVTYPKKITKLFSDHYADVAPNIDKKKLENT